jgi:hypothetical protein
MAQLFTPAALASLTRPATIAERWAAVQEHLHPQLALLAEQVESSAARRFPHQWALYETSYKSQRSINRGRGQRFPIDEYHVAFDRPPRGSGIIISVTGAEQAVLVGLQLWGVRKRDLHTLWSRQRVLWQPLIERIEQHGQSRFARAEAAERRPATRALQVNETDAAAQPALVPRFWIDDYLDARSVSYLWAGWVYPWNSLPDTLAAQLVEDVLLLFPLNEALMEQAEERAIEPGQPLLLREERAAFAIQAEMPTIETIVECIQAQRLAMSETTIRAYHVALQTRPLVILAGISGTGKTRLTRLYADAVHGMPSAAAYHPYFLVVAVQPDWHNARDLLGYYNALTGLYHPTPFLRFLLRAAADPHLPYFVCLDEMNLARPEYDLAPILSALETPERTIDLGAPAEEVQMVTGEMLRTPLRLPLNVALIGTVNVDESTYTLSDKLLDRANVIELTEVDLDAFRAAYGSSVDEEVWQMIVQVHGIVAQAGQPFGYRTLTEMLRYIEQAHGILLPLQALDLQIKQKVLPRLRGDDTPRLRHALGSLLALLLNLPQSTWGRASQVEAAQVAQAPWPQSAAKVRRMLERLEQDGFTDFYG